MNSVTALPADNDRRRPRAADRAATDIQSWQTAVVRTRESFDAMARQWEGLEAGTEGALLFQGSGWARAIFDFEAARGNAAFDPVVVTLSDGRRLIAVLPLERIRTPSRTVLVPLGHAFGQYADALISRGLDARETIARLLRAAISAAPCDTVSLLKVRSDSQLARGMPANHVVTGAEQGAPYVALDGFADYAAFFQTIGSKTRKNMRNDRNRLEREGELVHCVAQTQAERLGVISRTLQGRANRLRHQGLSSRAFRDGHFLDFCLSLAQRDDLELLAMSLLHKGEPIAEQWGFIHRGRYYAFVASRDFGNHAESPGRLHLGEVIQVCAQQGLHGADLMVPVMPYKLTWATDVVTVKDYALPVTPRGALVIKLWDKTLRPLFKQAILRMPKGPRSVLMKAVGRSL